MSALWCSVDPRTGEVVAYKEAECNVLEAARTRGESFCDLHLPCGSFRVDFHKMVQVNSNGGQRKVIPPSATITPPELPPAQALSSVDQCRAVLAVCARMDAMAMPLLTRPGDPPPHALGGADLQLLTGFATQMIHDFAHPRFQQRYGAQPSDQALLAIPPDAQVPAYFANVAGGSIFQRKVLSMLGLRNLLHRGPEIFREMQEKLFSGSYGDYAGHAGLHKMKHFTGNVVDLDTVLVRCTDKSLLQGAFGRKFRNAGELSGSPEVEEYVMREARERIAHFRELFGIVDDAVAATRRILLPPAEGAGETIPVARGHTERSHVPVWHYVNAGQDTYHVNVPEMPDVHGALLRAPFHMVRAYAQCRLMAATGSLDGGGAAKPPAEERADLERRQGDFFEDCISDSCFNLKWKSIELFCGGLESERGMFDVICKLQKDNQDRFRADLTDEEEAALLVEIAAQSHTLGRDSAGRVRAVTEADVQRWARVMARGVMEDF